MVAYENWSPREVPLYLMVYREHFERAIECQCSTNQNVPKGNLSKPRKLLKPKGVTTQMKALNEYFLMAVFTLLLSRVHICANCMFNLNRETSVRNNLVFGCNTTYLW